jgi:hypothetical protein
MSPLVSLSPLASHVPSLTRDPFPTSLSPLSTLIPFYAFSAPFCPLSEPGSLPETKGRPIAVAAVGSSPPLLLQELYPARLARAHTVGKGTNSQSPHRQGTPRNEIFASYARNGEAGLYFCLSQRAIRSYYQCGEFHSLRHQ